MPNTDLENTASETQPRGQQEQTRIRVNVRRNEAGRERIGFDSLVITEDISDIELDAQPVFPGGYFPIVTNPAICI